MKKIILTLFFSILLSLGITACKPSEPAADIIVFTQTGCPHCEHAMLFINDVIKKQKPHLTIAEYNIRDSQKNYDLFLKYVKKYNITGSSVGTPLIITKGVPFVGWDDKTQVKLLETINK